MLETNARIVEPGKKIELEVRCIEISAAHISPELKEKSCSVLANHYGISAVPHDTDTSSLYALTNCQITQVSVDEDNQHVNLKNSDRTKLLKFSNPKDRPLIAQLLERQFVISVEQQSNLWRFSNSKRIWYEPEPFKIIGGIGAYRRYELSAIPIKDEGIGLVVDVSTAFFAINTIAEFFGGNQSELDRKRNQKRFHRLSQRQDGQKGTLWYDSGNINCVCYFERFVTEKTCSTYKNIKVNGHTYESLLDYYHQKGITSVQADDPVALVSFPGIDNPQAVAANRLRLRVMNEALPKNLRQVDKIEEEERCRYIENFWNDLGDTPLGNNMPLVASEFWQPSEKKVKQMNCPDLLFGQGEILSSPMDRQLRSYREYYRQRLKLLDKHGCVKVPPTVPRQIYIAVPNLIGAEIGQKLGKAVTSLLSKWTRKPIKATVLTYDCFEDAVAQLRKDLQPSLVIFVFENKEPAIYYNVSYDLSDWRIKRITSEKLNDFSARSDKSEKGSRDWQSFIDNNALDILQLMDCIPWGFANPQNYQAQLAIDVGWDRRNYALSLLTNSVDRNNTSCKLSTIVDHKVSRKKETINEVILGDKIVDLFERGKRKKNYPIERVLVLRDGRECGKELDAVATAQEQLIKSEVFAKEVQVDVIDVHKTYAKGLRFWNRNSERKVQRVLEGTALLLDERTVILASTGAPTLNQGTTNPVMLEAKTDNVDMIAVAEDFYAASQLNWSSPNTAQRLTITLKRTDDELKNHAAQEIRLGLLRGKPTKIPEPEKVGSI